MRQSEAPARRPIETARPAGNEVSSDRAAAPLPATLVNGPREHIRTVLQILELAAEHSRHMRGPAGLTAGLMTNGDIVVRRQEVADIENALAAALVQLQLQPTPIVTDKAQLSILIEDLRPKQLVLLDTVPRMCAPAFGDGR